MTCAPAASAARTCEIAGSPDRMSRVVVSTSTRVSARWERSCATHSSVEGPGRRSNRAAFGDDACSDRMASRPALVDSAAMAAASTMPTMIGSIPSAASAARDSSSSWTNRRATFPNPTSSSAIFTESKRASLASARRVYRRSPHVHDWPRSPAWLPCLRVCSPLACGAAALQTPGLPPTQRRHRHAGRGDAEARAGSGVRPDCGRRRAQQGRPTRSGSAADAMTSLQTALKSAGVPADAIRTTGYTLTPENDYMNGRPASFEAISRAIRSKCAWTTSSKLSAVIDAAGDVRCGVDVRVAIRREESRARSSARR